MSEQEKNITPKALDELISEVGREIKFIEEGTPIPFEDARWIRFLVTHVSPGSFQTDAPGQELRRRSIGVALDAFKLGLLIGGGRMDLEDWFRARSIDHYRNQGGQNG